jgi:DNA (cytosine-5)-methyltransferase 1
MEAVSLFSGAGGMDLGMETAGFKTVFANDFDKYATNTLRNNLSIPVIETGCVTNVFKLLKKYKNIDLLHGGPPCQGFSVAGKMDPNDPRSAMLWNYCEAVRIVRPKVFVAENVAALAKLEKWRDVRIRFMSFMFDLGYSVSYYVAKSCDFNVPQTRERVFFIGKLKSDHALDLEGLFELQKKPALKIKNLLTRLGRPGTNKNNGVCNAKISIAQNPILRKSPYAGMLFNGLGRPLNLEGYAPTMHASMGGNKTPFIDEKQLYEGAPSWVEKYHSHLMHGGKPYNIDEAPLFLRRITVSEAAAIQTFPRTHVFDGPKSAQFRQIGNAVPVELSKAVGKVCIDVLKGTVPKQVRAQDEFRF